MGETRPCHAHGEPADLMDGRWWCRRWTRESPCDVEEDIVRAYGVDSNEDFDVLAEGSMRPDGTLHYEVVVIDKRAATERDPAEPLDIEAPSHPGRDVPSP